MGDHCQGQYRGDWYGAKVLEVAPDSVTVLWDPPHDKWGPLMLGRTMVKTDPPQTPEQEAAEERMTAWRAEQIADSSHPLLTVRTEALQTLRTETLMRLIQELVWEHGGRMVLESGHSRPSIRSARSWCWVAGIPHRVPPMLGTASPRTSFVRPATPPLLLAAAVGLLSPVSIA